jgi:cytoskeletal protein CcmA (bactofilin family)
VPVTLNKIEAACPECGRTQMESENFISTVCRGCGHYFKSQRAKDSGRRKVRRTVVKKRELTCAECGSVQEVAEAAQSSSCLACGRHLELGHREINGEHLGNLTLEGELKIGPKGNFGGSRARAARIVLQGRAGGYLEAAEWLRVEGQAKLRTGASGGKLEVAAGAAMETGEPIQFESGEIDGELRCPVARFAGPLRIGPQGVLMAEKVSFTELTVEPGGKIRAQAETVPN